jgi:hypothetical protein
VVKIWETILHDLPNGPETLQDEPEVGGDKGPYILQREVANLKRK